jgi:hypothetical protein
MNTLSRDAKFALKLQAECGFSPTDAEIVMENLADDNGDRLDLRSASIQVLLVNLIGKEKLVAAAEAIKSRRNQPSVTKVEIVNLPASK